MDMAQWCLIQGEMIRLTAQAKAQVQVIVAEDKCEKCLGGSG